LAGEIFSVWRATNKSKMLVVPCGIAHG